MTRQLAGGALYDFEEELIGYCKSDVKLLKQGCLTFRRDFELHAAFDSFEQMTIASACNRYLRMHCLTPETIASEPLLGWRGQVNHSKVDIEWLMWCNDRLETERWLALSEDESNAHDMMALAYDDYADQHHPLYQSHIQHARNVGEHRIPGTHYAVDGYDPQAHTAHEFYGCFWHGCRTCHPQRTKTHERLLDPTMDEDRRLVDDKRALLQARRYELVEIWECEWRVRKETNTDIVAFVARLDLQDPLNPRDAFYGGRTNGIKLYHQVREQEEIRYDDFTSL